MTMMMMMMMMMMVMMLTAFRIISNVFKAET